MRKVVISFGNYVGHIVVRCRNGTWAELCRRSDICVMLYILTHSDDVKVLRNTCILAESVAAVVCALRKKAREVLTVPATWPVLRVPGTRVTSG